jgi:hypothetical protein
VLTAVGLAMAAAGLKAAKDGEVHGGTVDSGTRPAPVPIVVAPPVPTKGANHVQGV